MGDPQEKETPTPGTPTASGGGSPAQAHVAQAQAGKHEPDPEVVDKIGSSLTDSKGTQFDPNLHEIDADGKPVLRVNGEFKKKRGHGSAKKKGATTQTRAGSKVYHPGKAETQAEAQEARQAQAQADQASRDAQAREHAVMIVGVVTGSMANLMGENWLPKNTPDRPELAMLENSTAQAFQAWGMTDIPPGWALTLAWGQYALPRILEERKKPRAQRIWDKIFKRKPKPEAQDKREPEKSAQNGQEAPNPAPAES